MAEGFVRSGDSGAVASKQRPGESRLLKVASYDERIKMPPRTCTSFARSN